MQPDSLILLCQCDYSAFLFVNLFQYLLNIDNKWAKPKLLKLPERYYEIFRTYRHQQCQRCSTNPKDPALCLICGAFLCFRESCCADSATNVFECVSVSIWPDDKRSFVPIVCPHNDYGQKQNNLPFNEWHEYLWQGTTKSVLKCACLFCMKAREDQNVDSYNHLHFYTNWDTSFIHISKQLE